jgi:hypothetical protein
MAIQWFSTKDKRGTASFYSTNITLNTIASVPFEYAYRVQVGIDDKGNVVIQPLSKDRVTRGDLDEYAIQQISVRKTYSRISSTPLMTLIAEALEVEFSADKPMKFVTTRDDKENILTIHTGKEDK